MKHLIKVTTRQFDVAGNGLGRVTRHYALWKAIPIGAFGGGPAWQCLAQCWYLKCLGWPLFWLALRFERTAQRFFKFMERRRKAERR